MVKKNQRERFADETMVDKIVQADEKWRRARFDADNWNKLKNLASKVIGEKMKRKEPQGDDDTLSDEIKSKLAELTKEDLELLTVFKIKKVRSLIDEEIEKNKKSLSQFEN